jgi:glycosyltransferase involved in cell wall biosynthesis
VRVHQLLSGAGPVDAVTAQALAYRALFEREGIAGGVHAAAIEPRVRRAVDPLARLRAEPGDVLLIHYSAYAPRLEPLLDAPQRKLLVHHNVTPARYLWARHPHVATLCQLGRDQLPRYARGVDVAAAVSEFNARELADAGAREPRVVGILFDAARLGEPARDGAGATAPLVLCVGRLVPHKRPDLVLRAFALYQSVHAPDARLLLAGEPLTAGYGGELAELAAELGARNVEIPGALPQGRLNAAWREASALLSMSEHEGFCVPLLEAFHFGVPVVARPAGGMPEVGGDAVLWTDADDLAEVAELVQLAVSDEELRAELRRRGSIRLREFDPAAVGARILSAVHATAASR